MKTEHEFFSQVDSLTSASIVASAPTKSDRLTKLGDLKARWRSAKGDQVKLQELSDELDAIGGQVRDEIKAKAAPDAKPPTSAFGKPTAGAAGATGATGTSHGTSPARS